MYQIITNNSKCRDKYHKDFPVLYLEGKSYMDVLLKVRDYIHMGYCLETHPMAGSLKPNQIPFRSIVISDRKMDQEESLQSIMLIENGIQTCQKFMKDRLMPDWNPSIWEDFQDVDLSLIDGGVNRLL